MKKPFGLLLFCSVLAGNLAAAEPEFVIGSTIHYAFDECPIEESLFIQSQGGHNSFRTEATWQCCTKLPDGSYKAFRNVDEAFGKMGRYHLAPIMLLCGTVKEIGENFPYGPYVPPYRDFCTSIASRYRQQVPIFQIWNEWDGGHMMAVGKGVVNTAENYLEMLKKVYPAVKKAAPESFVVSNSFSTGDKFLFRTFELGLQDYCDAYTIHTYDLDGTPEKVYRRLLNVERMSAKYHRGTPLPFYVTEMSWYTSVNTISEAEQGDYIARFYLLCKAIKSCRGVYWYNFNDRGFNCREPELFWGMTMRDMTPKEAFYALESVSQVVRKGTFVKRLDAHDPNVWLMVYRMPDNTCTLAAWTLKKDVRQQIILNKRGRKNDGELVLTRCGSIPLRRHWGFRDQSLSREFGTVNKKENPEQFSFHTTTRPVLLSGLPADFELEFCKEYATPQAKPARIVMPTVTANVGRTPSAIRLDTDDAYRITAGSPLYGGPKDLACRIVTRYDDRNLYLTFYVTDQKFVPYEKKGAYWYGDSIQLEFNTVSREGAYEKNRHGYCLAAAGKGGVVLHRQNGGRYGTSTRVSCRFIRKKNGTLVYAVTIPFAELGADLAELAAGRVPLCMALRINDNDGVNNSPERGRKGFLFWGDGVEGDEKSVAGYGWLVFRKK